MIHADEKASARLTERVEALQTAMASLEKRSSEIKRLLEEKTAALREKTNEVRERQRTQRAKHVDEALGVVFTTLCDYGVTMRHLPADEHMSLVVERYDGNRSRVFVMPGEMLTTCSGSGAELRESAVS